MTIYSLDVLLSLFEPVSCSMCSSNYCFLTCIQISQEAGHVVWFSYLLKNFHSLLWFTQSKALVYSIKQKSMFVWNSCFFNDPTDVGNLISVSSAFSRFTYCWRLAWRILNITLLTCERESCSLVSNSLQPHGLYNPWNSPGQNTGVGSLSLLQGIFLTQGLNPGLPHHTWILYQLSHKGKPKNMGVGSLTLLQRIFPTEE